jgi:hypothetical protein
MSRSSRPSITRRRFVGLVAAGGATMAAGLSAAASAATAADAAAPAKDSPAKGAAAPEAKPLTPFEKELERQKSGTASTLKTIRDFTLPPGGDLPVVFRPLPTRVRKGR